MKIAITGGGNCYALEFARHVLAAGHEVLALGRSPRKPACFALDLAHPKHGYQYRQAPIIGSSLSLVMELVDEFRPAVIVNFAAQGEGAASFKPDAWHYFYRTNVAHLVAFASELAQRDYLQRFVQIGTSELYGSVVAPADEYAPLVPTSPYAHSKAAFDQFLGIAHAHAGFPMNIVRPSNCYVSGQQLHRIIPRAMLSAITGKKLPLQGGGTARKSYLHAEDLAHAILTVIDKAPLGATYNVGPADPTSIRDVVRMAAKHIGVPFDAFVEEAPDRQGQDGCYWLDCYRMRALGWEPRVSWDAGLERMAAWIRAYKDELAAMPWDFEGLRA